MTTLRIINPTGEIPRLPPRLLPDNAASRAVNCDFAHGELRSLKGTGFLKNTSRAVRSVFSDDGLRFFAWPVYTRCFLAPTIDDMFERVYFENATNGLRVTRQTQMRLSNYGPPDQHWRVGMPVPAEGETTVSVVDADLSATVGLQLQRDGHMEDIPLTGVEEIRPGREYLLTYDASSQQTEGIFGGGVVTLEGVEFVEQHVQMAYTPVDSENTLQPPRFVDLGQRVARLALWEYKEIIGASLRTQRSDVAYEGTASDGVAGWFKLLVYGTNHSLAPATEYAPISIQAKALGTDTLECTYTYKMAIGDLEVAVTRIVTNVLKVKHNGQWMSMGNASGVQISGATLFAVVSGQINGEDYVAASEGSLVGTTNDAVTVSLVEEAIGEVRVFINYGESAASDAFKSVAYAVTFVNDWGEESAPTAPVIVERDIAQTASIVSHYQAFPDGRSATGMNVYRTYATGDAYLLVNRVPILQQPDGSWRFEDASSSPQTATTLASAEWDPPNASLHSLTYAGNGFFAGAVGHDLYFSEPYHPHAWPYAMSFTHAIVGLEAVENGLLVTTLERPTIVYGAHPEQMAQQVINAEQAGVAQRSMTRSGGNAVYVSNDGFVEVSGGLASLAASQNLFARQDFRGEYLPRLRNLVLGSHDGALVGVTDPESPAAPQNHEGFIIRLDEAAAGSYTRLSLSPTPLGMSLVPEIDALFLGFANGFAEYGAGGDLPFFWRSKEFDFPQPVSFGAVVVDCSPGLVISFYSNGAKVYEKQIGTGESSFRLPSLSPQKTWAVEFSGTGTLRRFEMATSFTELKSI